MSKHHNEEKELNLCELLKGCEGEVFYSLIVGDVIFEGIDSHWEQEVYKPIICTGGNYNSDGTYTDPSDNGVCCLYPSRALYEKYPLDPARAWQIWAEERKPKRWRANIGGVYWRINVICDAIVANEYNTDVDNDCYNFGNYFLTKEEAQQAAKAVRRTLEEFHENQSKQ